MASRDIYEQSFDEDVAQNEQNTCPECSGRVTTTGHETVCDECGLVIDDQEIDLGPEWRSFNAGVSERSRVGPSNTVARHDRGIGTEIGWNRDAKGRTLGNEKRRQLQRLRREHSRAQIGSKYKRNQITGFIDIRRMTAALGLAKSIRDQACQLFETAQSEDLLRGRSIDAVAAASLYAVCRVNEQPRQLGEIAHVSKVGRGRIENAYRVLNRELGLPIPPAGPKQYLAQIASAVDASREARRRARELLENGGADALANGKHPGGAAAGALYLAAQEIGEFITQQELADATDVSRMTIRERYRELETVVK